MNKNILIEEADEHLRLITEEELKKIEDSAEEFDRFTGIRVVGKLQDNAEIKKLIDEMIDANKEVLTDYLWENDIVDEMEEKILKLVGETYVKALTELKEKFESR